MDCVVGDSFFYKIIVFISVGGLANACNPDPCKNNGRCIIGDRPWLHTCRCQAGWWGTETCDTGKLVISKIIRHQEGGREGKNKRDCKRGGRNSGRGGGQDK